ncbi:MAG: hypothetical protein JST46_09950 [Bacteroidetes bacterium]|nr:hypothetical protein [Bacteroidota bacterium]
MLDLGVISLILDGYDTRSFRGVLIGHIILIGVLSGLSADAQNLSPASRRNPYFTDLLNGLPIARPPSEVQGDIYMKDWLPGTVSLMDRDMTITGYLVRYNIYLKEVEFHTAMGDRALQNSLVREFTINDTVANRQHHFINGKSLKSDGVPIWNFFELLYDGKVPLLKEYYVEIKDPDYQPALNAGSRDTRIIKHSRMWSAVGGDLRPVKGRKKVMEIFGDKAGEVDKYAKENTLAYNEEKDLVKIFAYYNTLSK